MVVFGAESKTADTSAVDANADPYAILRARVPELRNLSKETFPQYTSLIVAYMRGEEAKREDRLQNDIYAAALAGDMAKAFMEYFPAPLDTPETVAYANLRHRMIDDEIEENLSPKIQQAVIIGSGMDSRSYRLHGLANCHVFELDGCQELAEHKKRVLKELNAKLIPKAHDVIITNLAEEKWPEELISHGFDPKKPTLWIIEALLQYLDEQSVDRLFGIIDGVSAPNSVALVEMCGTGAINMDIVVHDNHLSWNAGTLEKRQEGGVLRALPWKIEMLFHRDEEANYSGRRWDPVKFARCLIPKEQATIGPWFVASCTKPSPQ